MLVRFFQKDILIYFVRHYTSQMIRNKLQSNRQVLKELFYNIRNVKLSVHESAKLTIKEASMFWNKARIPTSIVLNNLINFIQSGEDYNNCQMVRCKWESRNFRRKIRQSV